MKEIKSYSYHLTYSGALKIYVTDMSGNDYSIAEISGVRKGTEDRIVSEILEDLGYVLKEVR